MEIEIFKMIFEKRNNADHIQVTGDYFVKINKNKGKLIIYNKKYPIKGSVPINVIKTNKIKMILYENIHNKSCMFKNCELLTSLSRILYIDNMKDSPNNDDEYEVIFQKKNISYNFFKNTESDSSFNNNDNSSLISEIQKEYETKLDSKNISYWLKNINDLINKHTILKEMFSGCISLVSLPGISNWDITDVIDISKMFSNCISLTNLPNLSEWNVNNVIDISYLFSNCKKLISLPDISNWKTSNIIDCKYIFSNCESLTTLPDISKWNVNKITDMKYMFYNCKKLISLPDISKWNITNVTNLSYIFSGCESLSSLPNISKWNTTNVRNMSHMFSSCESLKSLPDISR